MITLLDGTKLPCHDELYKSFENIADSVLQRLYLKDIERDTLIEILRLNNINVGALEILKQYVNLIDFYKHFNFEATWKFETYDWDVVLQRENKSDIIYNIEYKSNINEWKKGINDFLNQINKRSIYKYSLREGVCCSNSDLKVVKVLMSFDSRFLEYESTLKKNYIRLLILPQSLLEQK